MDAGVPTGEEVMKPAFISEEQFTDMLLRVRGGGSRTAPTLTRSRDLKEGVNSIVAQASEKSLERIGKPPSPAGSNPAPSPYSPYVNKWELSYSNVLEMEQRIGAIKSWKYSGLTFTTAYRQYHRIDFIIGHNDRSIEIAQVKGYHPNMRAAIKGLKWAAQLYPMFTWTLKWWTGTGWDGKYVEI